MTKNNQLPDELKRLLDESRINVYEIIDINIRKKRYCLSGTTCLGQHLFIKWNENKPEFAFQGLRREVQIYKCLSKKNITPEIYLDEPFLATKFEHHCNTLRECILNISSDIEFERIMQNAIGVYTRMLDELNHANQYKKIEIPEVPFRMLLKKYFSILASSGPRGCVKTKKWEQLKNKLVTKMIFCKEYIHYTKNHNHMFYLAHGDFHLNNLLVNEKLNVFIIDFENIYCGDVNTELAYWYVQIWILINRKSSLQHILDREINQILRLPYFQKELFWEIVALYKIPIKLNRKWHRNE